ncbi:unnamed protein product [Peniophora sp. CBMAI 1063]|nr:unnamed protein product [Peniophora sp. CBMAI 1063]
MSGHESVLPVSPRLDGLPNELVSEIAVCGQLLWLAAACGPHAAATDITRSPPVIFDRDDCRGVTAATVPECLWDAPLPPQQPAHALMHTCSRLYRALRNNIAVWQRTANTLWHSLGCMAGERTPALASLAAVGARFHYNSDVLVTGRVCSCIISGIRHFYPALRVVKISLPWADFAQPIKQTIAPFFILHHSQAASPLEYFELELHEDRYTSAEFITARSSPAVKYCLVKNLSVFYYGSLLRILRILFPPGNCHYFGPNLLNALNECRALEFLTIDAGSCELIEAALGQPFEDELPDAVYLQYLQYLRLALLPSFCSQLLQRFVLPPTIDMHLEPTVNWRAGVEHNAHATSAPLPAGISLWQYAAALAAPAQARALFNMPAQFIAPVSGREFDILQDLSIIGMDIRPDPAHQRSCDEYMLPESIGFSLASSERDIADVQRDATRGSRSTAEAHEGLRPRRSLTVRDAAIGAGDWDLMLRQWPSGVGLALVKHVGRTLTAGQMQTAFQGFPSTRHLVIAGTSWLPQTARGWEAALSALSGITRLTIRGGQLTNVQALVEHLQAVDKTTPMPHLQGICLPRYLSDEGVASASVLALATVSNAPRRLQSGASVIQWTFGT